MKGTAIVELMTMIALKRRGVPLSRDVILVANADEETGSTGAEWFAREKKALLRNAEFLVNEGGHNRRNPGGAHRVLRDRGDREDALLGADHGAWLAGPRLHSASRQRRRADLPRPGRIAA